MNRSFNIIAETAFSHEGDPDYLFAQIDAAKMGHADYIKFQILLDPETSYVPTHPMLETVRKWQLSKLIWTKAFEYAQALGLKVLALPVNVASADFCMRQDALVDALEIHSICFNEYHLLRAIAPFQGKIFLGVGGRLPEEIAYFYRITGRDVAQSILMYGIQSFPTPVENIHLSRIGAYIKEYGTETGYADHTDCNSDLYLLLNDFACVQGASYFEKHIVVHKGVQRTDYESAIDSTGFLAMRERLNAALSIMGSNDITQLREQDAIYRNREKKIVAKRLIPKGAAIEIDDLTYAITTEISDIRQRDISLLVGKCAARPIPQNTVVCLKDVVL